MENDVANNTNEVYHTGASVRRTLNIGDYESITIELPILNNSEDLRANFWETVKAIDNQLLEWANHIYHGRQSSNGKGVLIQLSLELQYATNTLNTLTKPTT